MNLSALAKRMIKIISVLLAVMIAAAIIYYRSLECLPFILGALLGSATSIVKVLLLEQSVDKALGMDRKKAGTYMSFQYFLRLGLTGMVLLLGALLSSISLWGVAAGILSFQIAVYGLKDVK